MKNFVQPDKNTTNIYLSSGQCHLLLAHLMNQSLRTYLTQSVLNSAADPGVGGGPPPSLTSSPPPSSLLATMLWTLLSLASLGRHQGHLVDTTWWTLLPPPDTRHCGHSPSWGRSPPSLLSVLSTAFPVSCVLCTIDSTVSCVLCTIDSTVSCVLPLLPFPRSGTQPLHGAVGQQGHNPSSSATAGTQPF